MNKNLEGIILLKGREIKWKGAGADAGVRKVSKDQQVLVETSHLYGSRSKRAVRRCEPMLVEREGDSVL